MPVIVTTPEPGPQQREIMEALGFRLLDNEGGSLCTWSFHSTLFPPDFIGNGFHLDIHEIREPLSIPQAVGWIIKQAFTMGQKHRAKAINELLKA